MQEQTNANRMRRNRIDTLTGIYSRMKKLDAAKSFNQISLIFAIYTLYILVLFFQSYSISLRSKNPTPLLTSAMVSAVWGYTWALFTPLIARFGRRFSIVRRELASRLMMHLLMGIAFSIAHRVVFIFFQHIIAPETFMLPEESAARIFWILRYISDGLFQYIFIVTVYQAYLHFQEAQEREFRLQQAELQTLKTQLHPHFLFNTLNAISSLGFAKPEMASRVVAQLSDLLRFALKTEKAAETTLKEELDFVRKYLQIQQIMLQERLTVEWHIAPETLDAYVPNMILQPLVENSIRHGIAPKETGGTIKIASRKISDTLCLEISDDGLGLSLPADSSTAGSGIGLENTRTRLQHLYGEAFSFELLELPESGLMTRLTMPFKEGN